MFHDPLHASKTDPHPDGERWHTIGRVGRTLLLVVHTWQEKSDSGGPEGRIISARKAAAMREEPMKKALSERLTPDQQVELSAHAALPDEAIDTSDARELADWTGAERGRFHRSVKQQLTLRLDADVVDWFRRHASAGEGYQTTINRVLRDYVRERAASKA